VADQRQSAAGQEADRSHARTPHEPSGKQIESRASIYGKRYLLEPAPDHKLPKSGMSAEEAAGLIEEEMVLDGLPTHNLATFVTTWMEPRPIA
jgi:glutamate decarboxylase